MKKLVRFSAVLAFGVAFNGQPVVGAQGEKHSGWSSGHAEKHTESVPSESHGNSFSSNRDSPTYLFIPAFLEERINAFKRMTTPPVHVLVPGLPLPVVLPSFSLANANKAVDGPVPASSIQLPPSKPIATTANPEDVGGPEKPTGKRLLKGKPPSDFKIAPMPLKNIHLSSKGHHTSKVNAAYAFHGDKLLINKHYNFEKDYPEKHGIKTPFGYAYRDKFNSHWHHSIWDPNFSCFYFYDQYSSSYYFWDEEDGCYYPIWWSVDFTALHSF